MIRISDDAAVRTITLDRPEVLNAFDTALYRAAGAALEEARADDEVKVVVITGAGRAFSAGQDLAELERITAPMLLVSATVLLHGSAWDMEESLLPDSELSWTSSLDGLLDDGLFAIILHHEMVGSLARAKAGDLAALRDLSCGALFVFLHFFRFHLNDQFRLVAFFDCFFDFQCFLLIFVIAFRVRFVLTRYQREPTLP